MTFILLMILVGYFVVAWFADRRRRTVSCDGALSEKDCGATSRKVAWVSARSL